MTKDEQGRAERLAVAIADELRRMRRIPRATYRVQLNADFTFRDAARIVPYLDALGVSDLYTSPYLKARPGSTHGYDVADYGALNPEIGSERDYEALVAALRRRDMGQLFDFVPNHMGIVEGANPWWLDVLENGQSSPYAEFFDIDWRPLKAELHGKVLLPMLGAPYGVALDNGELVLRYADGAFTVHYYQTPLPVAPPTYPAILRRALDGLTAALAAEDPALLEFQSIITALERLPSQEVEERRREQVNTKRRLANLIRSSPEVAAAVEEAVAGFNGTPGDRRSFDPLDQLLEAQSYRLAFWRVAAEEINYRRFFAINELAAIRQEVPAVFAATHAFLLRLLGEGKITGVRVDHPDGLWDPAGYFRDLQRAYFLECCRRRRQDGETARRQDGKTARRQAGEEDDWEELRLALGEWHERKQLADPQGDLACPLYVVGEKILEAGEALPDDWPIHGTTGYEFAANVTGLFVDGANRKAFDDLYARFIDARINFGDLVYQKKHLIMRVALASEVNVLARALNRISERDRRTRDFTLNNLRDSLREVIACFPVYRTYIVCDGTGVPERDRRYIENAVSLAKRRSPATNHEVFDFIRDVLLLRSPEDATEEQRAERCHFAMKLQQLTGPVMAKGLEDTAFYIYNRLTSLNEVGGDPTRFGISVAEFHRQNVARRERWPHALNASSTHDTKRSEDVRARINVLSELPREWRAAINRWSRTNRRWKTKVDGSAAPDRNDEYLLYQTLLGVWPFASGRPDATFVERIEAYMLKAIREAQVQTSWVNPNAAYEEATARFVKGILGARPFLDDFAALQRKVAHFGVFNALSQQLLKLTAPGVPDLYQGTERWDFSLVDPDNRRPVDYAASDRLLRDLRRRRNARTLARELVASKEDGRIKLYVTARTLACRRELPDLFATGDYLPLETTGRGKENVCAFARRADDVEVIVVVPRLVVGLTRGELVPPVGAGIWGDTALILPDVGGAQAYRNRFTGEEVMACNKGGLAAVLLADVLGDFPVALLEPVPGAKGS